MRPRVAPAEASSNLARYDAMRYGLRLLPDLYEGFNPMRYEEAAEREIEIGIDLRSAGFGVWQA